MLTTATFAMFLPVSVVPGRRPYVTRIRLAIVLIYFDSAAGFLICLVVPSSETMTAPLGGFAPMRDAVLHSGGNGNTAP